MGRGVGILSTLKIKQNGFCPNKGFCPSWKIYWRVSVHLVKMSGRDYIHVAQNMGGIMSTYTKMSRMDYHVRGGGGGGVGGGGFCPTLESTMINELSVIKVLKFIHLVLFTSFLQGR